MRYYIDTEFIEGTQDKRFLGIKYGNTKPTIDLISIGIVSEDNREYYAISKDFNLYEAWNRWQQRIGEGDRNNIEPKQYWIRDNVLFPIWKELSNRDYLEYDAKTDGKVIDIGEGMTYKSLKQLINKYGKTNKEIADDIVHFTNGVYKYDANGIGIGLVKDDNIQFYGYFSAYDWVAFCWLFGKMINLPKGISWYCRDLKQELDNKAKSIPFSYSIESGLKSIKMADNYPKRINEHNALSDAKWNKELHNFINNL